MFEVRRLRLLHALSTYGTVSATAAALHLTGPAVTQQLQVLEREVGMPLVERSGRRLKLTNAGQVLVSHTEVLLDQLTAAEADMVALRGEVSGTVRIATFPTVTRTVVPVAWRALRARHGSRLRLSLVEMEPEESLAALRNGNVDLAVAHAYDYFPVTLPGNCERHDLMTDPVMVAFPADDPLLDEFPPESGVELGHLAERDWVASRQGTQCHQMTQIACGSAGFVPRVVAQCTDFAAELGLVSAGVGVALIPRLATCPTPDGVVLRPLATPVNRVVFAVSRRGGDRHPAVRVTRDALADACQI